MEIPIAIQLLLRTSGIQGPLRNAEKAFNSFGNTVAQNLRRYIGVGAVAGLTEELVRRSIKFASKLDDVSTKLGIGSERLQQYGYGASKTGAKLEDVIDVLERLKQKRQEALNDPTGAAAVDLQKFGVTFDELRKKNLSELFDKTTDAISRMKNPAEQMSAAFRIFGDDAIKIISSVRSGFSDFTKEAAQNGYFLTDSVKDQLVELEADLDRFKVRALETVGGIVPPIVKAVGVAVSYFKALFAGLKGEFDYLKKDPMPYITAWRNWQKENLSREKRGESPLPWDDDKVSRDLQEKADQAFITPWQKSIEDDVRKDQAHAELVSKRQRTRRGLTNSPTFAPDVGVAHTKMILAPGEESGHFVGGIGMIGTNPILEQMKKSVAVQEKIEENTRNFTGVKNQPYETGRYF